MVRPIYRLSRDLDSGGSDGAGRRSIFAEAKTTGLNGFDEFPRDWAIDWDLYFKVGSKLDASRVAAEGRSRVQPSHKIDPSLVNPLAKLPEFKGGTPGDMNLALRNLRRGNAMELRPGRRSHAPWESSRSATMN